MHGVTAKVAQEVIVFLQDDYLDARTGKQKSVDESGGTAAGYTDLGSQIGHALTLPAEGCGSRSLRFTRQSEILPPPPAHGGADPFGGSAGGDADLRDDLGRHGCKYAERVVVGGDGYRHEQSDLSAAGRD